MQKNQTKPNQINPTFPSHKLELNVKVCGSGIIQQWQER